MVHELLWGLPDGSPSSKSSSLKCHKHDTSNQVSSAIKYSSSIANDPISVYLVCHIFL